LKHAVELALPDLLSSPKHLKFLVSSSTISSYLAALIRCLF
jgi:hypothetical protein